jgi:hypothetical protein
VCNSRTGILVSQHFPPFLNPIYSVSNPPLIPIVIIRLYFFRSILTELAITLKKAQSMLAHSLSVAGLGFLSAVLWFDLMFDVQAFDLNEHKLQIIRTFYRRATTDADPMGYAVAVFMAIAFSGMAMEAIYHGNEISLGVSLGSMLFTGTGITTAMIRTLGNAKRLGSGKDDISKQQKLAKSILGDHLMCGMCILVALVLQVFFVE